MKFQLKVLQKDEGTPLVKKSSYNSTPTVTDFFEADQTNNKKSINIPTRLLIQSGCEKTFE